MRLRVGIFGAPHGVRGQMRLKSDTQDPAAIATYGPLSNEAGTRAFTITHLRALRDDMFVVTIAGVSDRDAAQALSGTALFVDRALLPAPDDDEFYHADLIGLAVRDAAGNAIGTLRAIDNFGAGDVLDIATPDGDMLLPFTRACVPKIDMAGGFLVIVPPAEIEADAPASPPQT